MKKMILFLTLVFLIAKCFCQAPSGQGPSNDYLKKSKNQKTAACILLVGGIAMTVGGIISFNNSWENGSNSETDVSGYIMLIGIAIDIVSIPLFISSAVNKKKSVSLAITNQNFYFLRENIYEINSQPALTLRIKF